MDVLTNDKIDSIAAAIWHHWCQYYGNPETILSNQGKVWTSKLESRINSFTPSGSKIRCRSEKKPFNPEVREQWQQNQQDTSAEEFAEHWNFLCNLQDPARSTSRRPDHLDEVDQNLDDIEDFVEDEPERRRQPEDLDLDHEWLQLIQLEKAINKQKRQLLETEVRDHGDPDEDNKPFWEDGESLAKQRDHLDDQDLEYINNILNSFSRPIYNHEGSSNLKLKSITPEDALARAFASRKTPPEFNLKFNQKSTTRSSENDHFSHLSNVEEEGTVELGDYFSDDEEDDTWDREDLTSESNSWSHTEFYDPEENFPLSQPALYEWDPVISGLETIHEAGLEDDGEANKLNHISGLSEETQLGFSTWQPFIPLEHAFQNCAAQSQLSDFLSPESFLQEPTLTKISTISTSTKRTSSPKDPTSPRPKISLSRELLQTEFPDPSEPPSQRLRTKPCKPFYSHTYSATPTPKQPSFTKSSAKSALPSHEFPDHPEQLKRYKLWKQQSQGSTKTSKNQSTKFQNTPPETDAGSKLQGYIQLKSQSYSTMKSKRSTTEIKSLEAKWPEFSNKTPTYQTKSQKNTKPHRRNSRRIRLWLWSRGQSPPTCSLNTAKTVKKNQNKKICLHGEIHS